MQVKVLPQELVRCLRSYGVHVEGDPCVEATPDKRGPDVDLGAAMFSGFAVKRHRKMVL